VALASDEPSEAAASSATSAEPEAGAHPASSGGATAGAAAEPAASPNPPAPRAPPASERSPSRAEPGGGADARAEGARAEAVLGPAGGEPLEGDEADFDLGAFGIEEAPPPRSRRRRARTLRELIRQANILRNRDQLDEAQELYFRILSLDPDSPRATAGMIRVFLARDDADNAILFAQRLVRLRPAFASNWVLLGDTFERGHNPDAALRAWTHALELQPRWRPARERIRRIGRSGADSPRE
jgi:tetratricopeptide (TPR) repeat protein